MLQEKMVLFTIADIQKRSLALGQLQYANKIILTKRFSHASVFMRSFFNKQTNLIQKISTTENFHSIPML